MLYLRTLVSAMLIGLLAGITVPSYADDTDLYLRQITTLDNSTRPNILFMLDNSGSMNEPAGADYPNQKRIDLLKGALVQVLEQTNNVNVGVGRFLENSGSVNASIEYPVSYIDELLDDEGTIGGGESGENKYNLAIPLALNTEDAEEGVTSQAVYLDDDILEIGKAASLDTSIYENIVFFDIHKKSYNDNNEKNANNKNVAREFVVAGEKDQGTVLLGTEAEGMGISAFGNMMTGLRFEDINIPVGAEIVSAKVIFTSNYPENSNYTPPVGYDVPLDIQVYGVAKGDTTEFSTTSGSLSSETNYPLTDTMVFWKDIPTWDTTGGEIHATPNISGIIQEIIDRSDWSSNNAISLKFIKDLSTLPGSLTYAWRSFETEAPYSPILSIAYRTSSGGAEVSKKSDGLNTVFKRIITEDDHAIEFKGDGTGSRKVNAGVVATDTPGRLWLGNHYCKTGTTGDCRGSLETGFRFTDVQIPQGATIVNARLEFEPFIDQYTKNNTEASLDLKVSLQDISGTQNTTNLPAFDGRTWNSGELTGNNGRSFDISDRTWSSTAIAWNNVVPHTTINSVGGLSTPDLSSLVQTYVNKSTWEKGGTLVFNVAHVSGSGGRRIKAHANTSAGSDAHENEGPLLVIDWVENRPAENQYVGLHFEGVSIPKGATITAARINFTSAVTRSGTTNVTLAVEGHDAAEVFTDTTADISSRSLESVKTAWSISETWTEGETYTTPDNFKDVIQGLVNRSGWCGRNVNVIITPNSGNTGTREVLSYDGGDSSSVPTLYVEFDTTGLPVDACVESTFSKRIVDRDDDVEETVLRDGQVDGAVFKGSRTLEMTTTSSNGGGANNTEGGQTKRIVGLRFPYIPLRQGQTVLKAELQFYPNGSGGSEDEETVLEIRGELKPTGKRFETTVGHLSTRMETATSPAIWRPGPWAGNSKDPYKTVNEDESEVDLAAVVQQVVNQPQWEAFNDMVFFISGTGLRSAVSFNESQAEAATLRVTAQGLLGNGGSATTRTLLQTAVRNMFIKDDAFTPIVDALYEATLYFQGEGVKGGKTRNNKFWHSISHPKSHNGAIYTPPGCTTDDPWSDACATERITTSPTAQYHTPITSSCQANHIVLLSDGMTNKNTVKGEINVLLGGGSDGTCVADYRDGTRIGVDASCGVDLARYINRNNVVADIPNSTIATHTIGFQLGTGDEAEDAERFLRELAYYGGGDFYEAKSADDLVNVFKAIIAKAMTQSTAFAAPSVSVSTFNRLFHRNEVYLSIFKPNYKKRWEGNVKKFLICDDESNGCTQGQLLDKNGDNAVSSSYIADTAHSFWSAEIDGPVVTKGGAGERMPHYSQRKVYTCTGNSCDFSSMEPIIAGENVSAEAQTALDPDTTLSTDELNNLIDWISGKDVDDEDGNTVTNESRWAMADPLHSGVSAITYGGTEADPITKLFVGSNDGLMHMFDASTGVEEWAFLPKELLGVQQEIRENEAEDKRVYGLDGSATFWIKDANDNGIIDGSDFVKMFVGMRRGGRSLYGFDVTNFSNPILMWTITGGTGDFTSLGQTWSGLRPTIMKINGKKKVVLVSGGGYDTTQDAEGVYSTSTIGNAIYIIDPDTGERLWSAGGNADADLVLPNMNYAIPSDIALSDSDNDGITDRFYVGDLGGQVWRIDFDHTGHAIGGRLAVLAQNNVVANHRRFFYPPRISRTTDTEYSTDSVYDIVTLVSGTRPDILGINVHNAAYILRDRQLTTLPDEDSDGIADDQTDDTKDFYTLFEDDLFDATSNVLQEGSDEEKEIALSGEEGLRNKKGWYINLHEPSGDYIGEKSLASPLIFQGKLYFTTYIPPQAAGANVNQNVCDDFDEGHSRLYTLDLLTGGAAEDSNSDGDSNDPNSGDGQKTASDRFRTLKGGVVSDISPVFFENGDAGLISNDLSTLEKPLGKVGLDTVYWKQQ